MSHTRVYNFAAGPSVLPLSVLERAGAELTNYRNSGMSVMEMSHRSKVFLDIFQETQDKLRRLMNILEGYHILFLQTGASGQFSMIPLNLMGRTGRANYAVTGNFSSLACKEAGKYGEITLACDTSDRNHCYIPRQEALKLILNERGIITPYGVVYDNGMRLEPLYDGRHFPSYLYKSLVVALETVSGSDMEGYFCLPMSDQQIQRMIERSELEIQNAPLKIVTDALPEKVAEALNLESLSVGDISALNRMCRAIEPLKDADMEKLNAIVLTAEPEDIMAVCQLADQPRLPIVVAYLPPVIRTHFEQRFPQYFPLGLRFQTLNIFGPALIDPFYGDNQFFFRIVYLHIAVWKTGYTDNI